MLINRNYTWLWIGQATAAVGDVVFSTGLLIWIGGELLAGDSRAPMASTAVMVLVSVTAILLGPPAGVFVERWNKRAVMLWADLLRAIMVGGFAAIAFVVDSKTDLYIPMWLLLVMALLVVAKTGVAQFFVPARFVLIRDVVPEEKLGRASSYAQSSQAITAIIAPALAASMVTMIGIGWALVFNAVTFIVSYIAVRQVKVSTETVDAGSGSQGEGSKSFGGQFLEGLNWIRRNFAMVAILTMTVIATFGVGAMNALELYFVQDNLGAGSIWLGIVNACFGAGVFVGALATAWLSDRFRLSTLVWVSIFGFGVLFVVYSRLTDPWIASGLNVLFGVAVGLFNSALFPLIQQIAPRDMLARVGSVLNPVNTASRLLSMSLSAVLVSTVLYGMDLDFLSMHFGAIDTLFLIGGFLCVIAGLWARSMIRKGEAAISDQAEVDEAATA